MEGERMGCEGLRRRRGWMGEGERKDCERAEWVERRMLDGRGMEELNTISG